MAEDYGGPGQEGTVTSSAARAFYADLPDDQEPRVFDTLLNRRTETQLAIERVKAGETLMRAHHDGSPVPVTAEYLYGLADSDSTVLGAARSQRIDAVLRATVDALRELAGLLEVREARPRKSNRKITQPWQEGTLFPMPNIQNHGTRNLVQTISGPVEWIDDPADAAWKLAVVNGQPIGRIDLTPGGQGLAERELTALVGPKAIKTMVATSRLIFERTNRQPLNKPVTLTVGEVARAAGYEPGQDRGIKPEILHRIGHELRALTRIMTWAADGPYDTKTGIRPSAWIAPLVNITAVHVEQSTPDGKMVPYEFDAMLGRNWAHAFANTDLLQVAAGFMELDEDNTIRLGWYYLTEFRYQMTSKKVGITRKIAGLCQAARIDTGQPKHRGRFLDRLEKWHDDLQQHGVIGFHRRSPGLDADCPPSQLFAEGEYFVRPPMPILEAYAAPREKAATRQSTRRRPRKALQA